MRTTFITALFCCALFLCAAEHKNISYYEKDAPPQGDIIYRAQRCKLDLITPETRNFPTLVWFHGGGLTRGGDVRKYPAIINRKSIAIATVSYRLSGKGASHPDYIYDAAAAVAWVLKNIEKFGGDPKKVYVSGHSAGGYLSAMVALDKKYLATFGANPKQLAGVLPISGQMSTHFRIIKERTMKDPAAPQFAVDEFAPLYHASADAPPMVFLCGDPALDWPARAEENLLLAARLTRVFKHPDARVILIPGTNHGSCAQPALAIINNMLTPRVKRK